MAKRKLGGDADRGDADQGNKVRRKDIPNQNKSLNSTYEGSSYKKKARGEKASAKPAPLSKVPLNVYIEVSSHLHPLDVLRLARSSRYLRDFLMSSKSRPVWQAAFANVDAPPCPADMNEPGYTALLFDKTVCMGCAKRAKNDASFTLRVRLCNKCIAAREIVRRGNFLAGDLQKGDLIEGKTEWKDSYRILFTMVPYREPIIDFPTDDPDESRLNKLYYQWYHARSFQRVAVRYFELAQRNPAEVERYVKEEQEKTGKIMRHARELQDWSKRCCEVKESSDLTKADEFRTALYEKLTSLGYTNEDFLNCETVETKENKIWKEYTHQAKTFTTRIWKNLQPKLEKHIRNNREYVRQEKVKARLERFKSLLKLKINAHIEMLFDSEKQESLSHGQQQAYKYVLVEDVNDLGFKEICFLLDAVGEDEAYDNIDAVPDEIWNDLLGMGLVSAIKKRNKFVVQALNKILSDSLDNLINDMFFDADMFDYVEDLSESITVHHAAAFVRYFCSEPPNYGEEDVGRKLFNYADVAERLGNVKGTFDELEGEHYGWNYGKDFWRNEWMGEQIATAVALTLLEELGYMLLNDRTRIESTVGNNGKDPEGVPAAMVMPFVAMEDMEAKGCVFVCMRCTEEGRCKRDWKGLVAHFTDEVVLFDLAKMHHDMYGRRHRVFATKPVNRHDYTSVWKAAISSPNQSSENRGSQLVVEDATFVDGPCPIGVEHTHGAPCKFISYRFYCVMCQMMEQCDDYAWNDERCAKTHIRSRHGKEVEEGDIDRRRW